MRRSCSLSLFVTPRAQCDDTAPSFGITLDLYPDSSADVTIGERVIAIPASDSLLRLLHSLALPAPVADAPPAATAGTT